MRDIVLVLFGVMVGFDITAAIVVLLHERD